MASLLTIGEVARRSGVAASALRFYEDRGLIIVFAQRLGLSLDEIGEELAKLPGDEVPTRRDWSRLSATWIDRIDDRMAEFERLKLGLTECIGCGCLSLDRCRLANPGDRASGLGPGPRYWIGGKGARASGGR
jgi:MerR family redox-sensitive transcriptional activator SoxR